VNLDQYLFAITLAAKTGLDPRVVIAWVHQEEPASASPTERGHNWLNVGVGSPGGPKGAGYGWSGIKLAGTGNPGYTFHSVNDATTETAYWINHMGNYAGIKASAKRSPAAQFQAIVASPWDAGHYGGSSSGLIATYTQEGGSSALGDVGGWLSSAGSAGANAVKDALNPFGLGGDAVNAAKGTLGGVTSVGDFLGAISEKSFWIRFAFVFVGLGFGIIGLIFLFESTSFGRGVTSSAVKTGAVAAAA
jgi:hypothetical protein